MNIENKISASELAKNNLKAGTHIPFWYSSTIKPLDFEKLIIQLNTPILTRFV